MSTNTPIDPNSKYAWRQLAQGMPKRPAAERVKDFLEIHGLYSEAEAQAQASRCLQCPNPSCVSGCPLCNPIPQWMQLTAEGRFLEAAAVLGSVTNMAEICARLCPSDRLCEDTCLLHDISEPVAIGAIEQFLVEHAFRSGSVDTATAPPNGLRVGIVGSGPGCLTCADELARRGCSVMVFDSSLLPGGLMVNGLPAFKIENSIVERRIEVLKKRGVTFRLGVQLGRDLTLTDLRNNFDACFLAMDSRTPIPLEIPGASLTGVVQALPFLLQKRTPVALDLPPIDVSGKHVVVIGAGDSAMDCLRAAIRWGAAAAICVYRRDEEAMPCSRYEYLNAREEGAHFLMQATPKAVLGDASGKVRALRLARTELETASDQKRRAFKVVPESEFELSADLVIPALGFCPKPCLHSGDFAELTANEWGGLAVDHNQMTNLPGVFAGGDIVLGPTTVLNIVRDGRHAADHISEFLGRRTPVRA